MCDVLPGVSLLIACGGLVWWSLDPPLFELRDMASFLVSIDFFVVVYLLKYY